MSATFSLIGTLPDVGDNTVLIKGNRAYIGGSPGLTILDITDKTSPVLLSQSGDIVDNAVGFAISDDGNTLYAAGVGLSDKAIYVIDVTDGTAPVQLGELEIADIDMNYFDFVNANQNLRLTDANTLAVLIIDNSPSTNVVQLVDVSNPAAPVGIPTGVIGLDFKNPGDLIYNMDNIGAQLYILVENTGSNIQYVQSYDVSVPSSPTLGVTSSNNASVDSGGFCVSENGVFVVYQVGPDTPWVLDKRSLESLEIVSELTTDVDAPIQAAVSGELLVIAAEAEEPFGIELFAVPNDGDISSQDSNPTRGSSVFFSSPYFYTVNNEASFDVWHVATVVAAGWRYGDNNVIYQ